MIKVIYKRKLLSYEQYETIPHELPYGLALELALNLAKQMQLNCDYVRVENT